MDFGREKSVWSIPNVGGTVTPNPYTTATFGNSTISSITGSAIEIEFIVAFMFVCFRLIYVLMFCDWIVRCCWFFQNESFVIVCFEKSFIPT
jgi:hypothetical protein